MNRWKTLFGVAVCFAMICSARYSLAQAQLISDGFDTGTNGSYLDANWTGCGYNNGAYNKLVYQNSEAGGSGFWAQDCALYTGYGPFPSDQYVTATVVAPTPASSPQASIQLRANPTPSTDEAYVACGWDSQDFPPDYHYRIWSLAPASPGPVSLWLSNITPAVNDVISCQMLGNVLTMRLNGSLVATVIDSSGNNTGYPGMYYVDPNGGSPSTGDVIFDSFSAGSGPALQSVVITPNTSTAAEGSYVQFSGLATYADGSTANMNNWSSSDPTVATVDASGFAYGGGAGTATITGASAADSGTATLTVTPANGYTPLVHDSFVGSGGGYLGANWTGCGFDSGAYSKLVYQNNQAGGSGYYSQNCSVYTGQGPFPSDQYATAMIVDPAPSSTTEAALQLRGNATPSTPESYIACGWDAQDFAPDYHYRIWSLAPGGTPTSLFLSKVTPVTNDQVWCQVLGSTVNMQVNGTTIATVTDNSGLTAGYPGMYYIDLNGDVPPVTDVIFDNFVAGQINGPVLASITITPNPAVVSVGSTLQLAAAGSYTDGTTGNVTSSVSWASSNPSIATVSSTGLASGASGGTVTITAVSGTKSATSTLTVSAVSPTVTFTGAPTSALYNSAFAVTATTNASTMPQITGSSGICSVASVTGTPANASAVVTMISGTGTCTLTANWAADANYSSPPTKTQSTTASKSASTVTITSNTPNPSTLRQAVTVAFRASGTGAGPTGSVTVTASTRESCTGTLVSGAGTCSITFNSGGSRTLTATYNGSSNFTASTSASVSQTVNSPTVNLSPTSLNFGSVSRNTNSTLAETVSNTGTGALINLSWSITGFNAARYSVSSTTCGTTLNPGSTCVINVTFRPNNIATYSATLNLTDNANNSPQTVALTGSGR